MKNGRELAPRGRWGTAHLKERTIDAKASGWEEAACVLGMKRKPWSPVDQLAKCERGNKRKRKRLG